MERAGPVVTHFPVKDGLGAPLHNKVTRHCNGMTYSVRPNGQSCAPDSPADPEIQPCKGIVAARTRHIPRLDREKPQRIRPSANFVQPPTKAGHDPYFKRLSPAKMAMQWLIS